MIMIFILVMLFGLALARSVERLKEQERLQKEKAPDPNTAHVIVEAVKTCPPHKWHYQEVKDTEGKTLRWRIVCDVCGPMKPIG